jgi:hypothetical protein
MSVSSQSDTAGESGFWAVSINGVDSSPMERYFGGPNQPGSMSAVYRSAVPLAEGTYTVNGRARVETSATITVNQATLVAIAMATTAGNTIPSEGVSGNDTVESNVLEDIAGLTGDLTLAHRNHIFAALAASTEIGTVNKNVSIGLDVNGEQGVHSRFHGTTDRGSEGAILQTLSSPLAGTRTAKGIWSRQSGGGLTTGDFQLVAFGLEDGIGSIYSAYTQTGAASTTTSASLVDIPSTSITVEMDHSAYVFVAMVIECENNTAATTGGFAINIDGTDEPTFDGYFSSSLRAGNVTIYARSATKLGPGTYTVKGRYATDGGTLSANDSHIFAMALEKTNLIADSSTSTEQQSTSSTAGQTTSSSSTVALTSSSSSSSS